MEGTVEGQELKPTATVLVKDAIAVQQISAVTPYSNTPTLPETVTVYNLSLIHIFFGRKGIQLMKIQHNNGKNGAELNHNQKHVLKSL